ncbi:MAG: tetratricopeptide repeat protein [Candidatus Hodarchaeales archaeon]
MNLAKITDDIIKGEPGSKETLRKQIKKLKNNIKNGLVIEIEKNPQKSNIKRVEIKLEGLEELQTNLGEIFGSKSWFKELETRIRNRIESEISEKKAKLNGLGDSESAKQIILVLQELGRDARKEKRFDKAITILQDTYAKLIPSLKLPDEDIKKLHMSILEELETALIQKGEIDKAIKVIDQCCDTPDFDYEEFVKAQVKKGFLLIQKGNFIQSINHLKRALTVVNSPPLDENCLIHSAEIKRVLGIAHRGQGAYKEALVWFKDAQDEFFKAKNHDGYHESLWGVGILHYMRGEWENAITIWEKLLTFYGDKSAYPLPDDKPRNFELIRIYTEYVRTLQLCGRYNDAEVCLNKALTLAQTTDHKKAKNFESLLYLISSELYIHQNKSEEAARAIEKVRQITKEDKKQGKETLNEFKILKSEIDVLLALDKAELARIKLIEQKSNIQSNWDQALYYRLLGTIEKHEMNFGLAKKAFKTSIKKIKDIGASSLSDELLYIELLIEMSRTGNKKALRKAESLLEEVRREITEKELPALILECKLSRAHLARVQSKYDYAFQLYSEVVREAENSGLFRQKNKALEAIDCIEREGQQLVATKDLSVFRYLEDARRILEENS